MKVMRDKSALTVLEASAGITSADRTWNINAQSAHCWSHCMKLQHAVSEPMLVKAWNVCHAMRWTAKAARPKVCFGRSRLMTHGSCKDSCYESENVKLQTVVCFHNTFTVPIHSCRRGGWALTGAALTGQRPHSRLTTDIWLTLFKHLLCNSNQS